VSANITLRLDEKTLKRIRHLAVDQQTSVSAWVGALVRRAVEQMDGYAEARTRALAAIASAGKLQGGPLTRDEAHDRRA